MIKVLIVGQYDTPHLVLQIGNKQTRMHSEQYSTRSNAKRAQRTLIKVLRRANEYPVESLDETVK